MVDDVTGTTWGHLDGLAVAGPWSQAEGGRVPPKVGQRDAVISAKHCQAIA